MRAGIALDHEPAVTAGPVIPVFPEEPRRVVTQIDIVVQRRFDVGAGDGGVGPLWRGIAEIAEFGCVSGSTERAGDAHGASMQVRLGALALFVDEVPGAKPVETQVRSRRVWRVTRDQMGEGKSGSGRGLEAAIAPAGVEIEALRRRAVDDRRP